MNTTVFSPEVIRTCILEGVESLRVRKCKPERENIAHHVLRKCVGVLGATPERANEIFNELEHIVDDGLLLKVEYKGSISYRTPESFDEKNSPLLTKHSKILNSSRTTLQILTTINDLIAANPDYCVSGIPWSELQENLEKLDSTRFSADKVDALVNREVSVGKVLVGDGKRVYPKDIKPPQSAMTGEENKGSGSKLNGAGENANVPKKRGRKPNAMKLAQGPEKEKKDVKVKPVKNQSSPTLKKVGRSNAAIEEKVAEAVKKTFDGRVSGRNKIKRKVFDPSDVPPPAKVPPKKKRRSSSANNADTCGICTRKMTAKSLIICSSCASAYHISCLNLSKDAVTAAKSQDWLCSDCRICGECSGSLKSSNYVECVKCKVGVHSVCAGIDKDYLCAECKPEVSVNAEDKAPEVSISPRPKRKGVGRPPKASKQSHQPDPKNVDEVESTEDLENSEDVGSDSGSASPSSKVKKSCRTVSVEDGNSSNSSTTANVKASSSVDTSSSNLVDGLECNKWTATEVEKFFVEKGLPEAGALFREQEVDGMSLLLMKRSDVIFGLRLRLGPALKVYKLILQLQNNVVKT